MNPHHSRKTMFKHFRKTISLTLIAAFIGSSLYLPQAQAGEMVMPVIPKPGTMVNLSPAYTPAYLKGIVIHPENALKFDFLIHKGNGNLDQDQKKEEYSKLIKYFLASLTVPDKDQWVNLSPYEKNRIIADDFGKTEMGRDVLGQDYLLKQITSSLMYPESGLGKAFWDKVYERAYKEFGTTDIPVNTFNKVWIVPDEALIYESGNTAYVVKSHLKVMLEEDYLSLNKHTAIENPDPKQNALHSVSSKVIKEIILPEIEREVNEDKNFSMLRQVFSGMLLATWYKMALKESLLGKVYADKAKVQGVNQDPKNNEEIYQRYLRAFKKGVYNYIKEDTDKYTNQVIPRKYFAGGFIRGIAPKVIDVSDGAMNAAVGADKDQDLAVVVIDAARVVASRVLAAATAVSLAGSPATADLNNRPPITQQQTSPLVNPERIVTGSFVTGDESRFTIGEIWIYNKEKRVELQSAEDAGNGRFNLFFVYEDNKEPVSVDGRQFVNILGILDLLKAGFTQEMPKTGGEALRRDQAQITGLGVPHTAMTVDQAKRQIRMQIFSKPSWKLLADKGRLETELDAIGEIESLRAFLFRIRQRFSEEFLGAQRLGRNTATALTINDIITALSPSVEGNQTDIRYHPSNAMMKPGRAKSMVPKTLADQAAVTAVSPTGGIDLNAANLDLQIKRDGNGVPLPISQQDMAQLSQIGGFVPRILEIRPASGLPFLKEIK